jgi:hypothetical protein
MKHREIDEAIADNIKAWGKDKIRQVGTNLKSKVSQTAKGTKEVEDRYNEAIKEYQKAVGRFPDGNPEMSKFIAWAKKQGFSSKAISTGIKAAGFNLITEADIDATTKVSIDTARTILRAIVGAQEEYDQGFDDDDSANDSSTQSSSTEDETSGDRDSAKKGSKLDPQQVLALMKAAGIDKNSRLMMKRKLKKL